MKSLTIEWKYLEGKSPQEIEDVMRLWLQKAWFDKDLPLKFIQHEDYSLTIEQDGFYTCRKCGRLDGSVVIHHIFGKGTNPELREHPWNHIPLCSFCHVDSSEFSAHKSPKLFFDWIKTDAGIGRTQWSELMHMAHPPLKTCQGQTVSYSFYDEAQNISKETVDAVYNRFGEVPRY